MSRGSHFRQTLQLHVEAPIKPAEGQPCNGCGVCCAQETCPLARLRFWQGHGPCPALTWSTREKRYFCGLLSKPEYYLAGLPSLVRPLTLPLLARWIAAGKGCDCDSEIQD